MTQHTDKVLRQARQEVAAAAADLEQVTAELQARTRLVERLEALSDELLDLLEVPALVVDPEGRVTAVSRGGVETLPALRDALGKSLRSVVPPLAEEVAALVAGDGPERQHGDPTPGRAPARPAGSDLEGPPAATALRTQTGTRIIRLPGGSALVVLQ